MKPYEFSTNQILTMRHKWLTTDCLDKETADSIALEHLREFGKAAQRKLLEYLFEGSAYNGKTGWCKLKIDLSSLLKDFDL